MGDEYRHDGGSNRAHDPDGNLIGWFVYTDDDRQNLELVDRQGERLTVERTTGAIVVRDQSGHVRVPRPVTSSQTSTPIATGASTAVSVVMLCKAPTWAPTFFLMNP